MDMFSLYHRDRGCFPLVVVPPMFHVSFVCVLHVVSRFQVIMFHAFAVPHLARRAGGAMQGIVENSLGSGVAKAGASCSRPAMAVISASCINWLLVMCGGRKLTTVPKVPRALRHACLPKQLC